METHPRGSKAEPLWAVGHASDLGRGWGAGGNKPTGSSQTGAEVRDRSTALGWMGRDAGASSQKLLEALHPDVRAEWEGNCERRLDSRVPSGSARRRQIGCIPRLLSLQDLFFKYTWNNFLHLQVELCIAAILSHTAREDRAAASGPEGGLEPPPSSGDPATPQPASSRPESTMVAHVSPAGSRELPCPAGLHASCVP